MNHCCSRRSRPGHSSVRRPGQDIAKADVLVVTIGTPIDEFQNPGMGCGDRLREELLPYMADQSF